MNPNWEQVGSRILSFVEALRLARFYRDDNPNYATKIQRSGKWFVVKIMKVAHG